MWCHAWLVARMAGLDGMLCCRSACAGLFCACSFPLLRAVLPQIILQVLWVAFLHALVTPVPWCECLLARFIQAIINGHTKAQVVFTGHHLCVLTWHSQCPTDHSQLIESQMVCTLSGCLLWCTSFTMIVPPVCTAAAHVQRGGPC